MRKYRKKIIKKKIKKVKVLSEFEKCKIKCKEIMDRISLLREGNTCSEYLELCDGSKLNEKEIEKIDFFLFDKKNWYWFKNGFFHFFYKRLHVININEEFEECKKHCENITKLLLTLKDSGMCRTYSDKAVGCRLSSLQIKEIENLLDERVKDWVQIVNNIFYFGFKLINCSCGNYHDL